MYKIKTNYFFENSYYVYKDNELIAEFKSYHEAQKWVDSL